MKNNNTILVGAVCAMVGVFIGYVVRGDSVPDTTMMQNMPMQTNGTNDMSVMMQNMNEGLMGKTGDDFDKEFLSEMIVHHQGAVDMAKQVLATSKRPELIKLAQDIISAQNGEIQMMKNWQMSWYK